MKNSFKNMSGSLIFTWAVSYLIMLIFPLVINSSFFGKIQTEIQKLSENYTYEILENKRQQTDNLLVRARNMALNLSIDSDIINAAVNGKNENLFKYISINKKINSYIVREDYFKDVFVYFYDSDYISGMNSNNYADIYYNVYFQNSALSLDKWKELLKRKHVGSIVKIPNIGKNEAESPIFVLYSVMYADRPAATVAIEISPELLIKSSGEMSYYIIDKENKVYLSDSDSENSEEINKILAADDSKLINTKINGMNVVLARTDSDETNWNYLVMMKYEQFAGTVRASRVYMVLSAVLCMIIGLLLVGYFVRKNYKPVSKIMNRISREKIPGKQKENEFTYIGEVLENMFVEKEKYISRYEFQEKIMRRSIISSILKNELNKDVSVNELTETMDIPFIHQYYVVLMYYIDDIDEMFFEKNSDTEENYELSKFIILNLAEDMIDDNDMTYVNCEVDRMACTVINSDNADIIRRVIERIKKVRSFAKENFNISFSVMVSDTHCGIDGLPCCYHDILECIEYKRINNETIICRGDIAHQVNFTYYYPIEKEEQILHSIRLGEKAAAMKLIDDIFDRNTEGRHNSTQMIRCLVYDITATLAKAINSRGECEDDDINNQHKLFGQIEKCRDINKARKELKNIAANLAEEFQGRTQSQNNLLLEKIKEYITKNYADEGLTVAMIADKFNMNANYLSTKFKSQYSIGMYDYITDIRIEKAKKILANENCTIEKVAMMTGYTNTRTFSRAFSLRTGVTPGKYKTIILKNESDDK